MGCLGSDVAQSDKQRQEKVVFVCVFMKKMLDRDALLTNFVFVNNARKTNKAHVCVGL